MADLKGKIRSVKDIEEIEKTPLSERFDEVSTYDILVNAAKANPDKVAVRFLPTCEVSEAAVDITYQELLDKVTQTANMFRAHGLKEDEAVTYLLPNVPEAQYAIWGGQTAGIVSAVNTLLRAEQIVEILRATGSKMLVALGPMAGSDIWEKTAEVIEQMPELELVFQVGGSADPGNKILSFEEELAKHPSDKLNFDRQFDQDDVCAYFHTGGTTGSPKVAQHSFRGEVYEAWATQYTAGYDSDSVVLVGLPLFHVNAVLVSSLAGFKAGATVLFAGVAGFRTPQLIPNFWKIVDTHKVTHFSAVPTIYSALLNVPLNGVDVSSLKFGICGAAPMPQEVIRKFESVTGISILEGYGLTEGTSVSLCNPANGPRPVGSIGIRYPYQQVAVKRVDEDGAYYGDCDIGEAGHICIKGPNAIRGYIQEQFNEKLFVGDGWLDTGDLGYIDKDGYFWLSGRAKDLIIRGGHNIEPSMIEECLHQHPSVQLAAAVGRPDAYAGEIPVAYVELIPGSNTSADEIRKFAEENIFERPALPAEVILIDEMPVTAVGKIFKPSLRYDIIARTFQPLLNDLNLQGVTFNVTVGAEGSHGIVATVEVIVQSNVNKTEIEQAVLDILGTYPVKYRLSFDD
ncbi:acyl-CoA synthetase [Sneathiella sp. P13V-1]|uniref:acyl-CoA synthetase n=1 Tax=Sneathiella sp. P13V-1 TaxID=2697366 RepID=UPI00187B33E8|nr:acyl-CoA synthetase [Sneathiella sp. P13V-1]MBE7635510.1 acyl-CoA synthetase [Sneathiella sp. P13V-1]